MKNTIVSLAALIALCLPSIAAAQSDIACTMQYAPVCGTENGKYKTFGNGCVLGAEKAVYQHEGECTAAELSGTQQGTYVPPAHCVAWNDGCNSCARQGNGDAACTQMACMGEPRAGFCTAYAETEVEEPSNPGTSVSGPIVSPVSTEIEVAASTTATTTDVSEPGFFARIWLSISSWFSGLF